LAGAVGDRITAPKVSTRTACAKSLWRGRRSIPSEVENGTAGEAATWTGRPEAEPTGSERIKSLEYLRCLDSARHDKLEACHAKCELISTHPRFSQIHSSLVSPPWPRSTLAQDARPLRHSRLRVHAPANPGRHRNSLL